MIRSTFSRSRVLAFFSSVALVACGAIAACSGFSSEDAESGGDGAVAAGDSGSPNESGGELDSGSDASVASDASDSSVIPVPLYTFCEAGLNDGSSPHYACLDFEHGDGNGQWGYRFPAPPSPALEITTDHAASGSRAARLPKNYYGPKVTPPPMGGTWSIAAKAFLEASGGDREAIRIAFDDDHAVVLSVTDGVGQPFNSTSKTRLGSIQVEKEKWVDVSIRVVGSPDAGGYAFSPVVSVGDASVSVPPLPFLGSTVVVTPSFGNVNKTLGDGGAGILVDDVVVDVVQ